MENNDNIPLVKENLESRALSESSKIAQIFELCLQPKTKEDLDNILLNFRERIKAIKENEYFGIFDCVSIYVLDYVYKHDTASFCSVSRTLYLYQMLDQLVLKGTNRNLICNCEQDCLCKTLQEFTNVYTYSKSEEMLVDVGISSILGGNLGLALYLVKFRLIEFPMEVNEKCKKMFEILVNMFNSYSNPVTAIVQADDMATSVQLNELLNQVKEKKINIKRSILTFCILTIVAEYKMYEKLEVHLQDLKFYTDHKKHLCLRKLKCINLYMHATTELRLTFKDIDNFTEVFLNSFLTAEVGKSLVETCRKLLNYSHNYYNPRSLKHLARLKVRSIFRNSKSIPEQVNELEIPIALKKFINFQTEEIFDLLVINHLNVSVEQNLNRRAPEIEGGNGQELEDGNVQELADENVQELADGNVQELGNGNVPEIEDRNEPEIENENVLQLEDGNVQNLADGNVQDYADGNVQDYADGNVQDLAYGNVQDLACGNVQDLACGNAHELVDGIMQKLADGNAQKLADGNLREIKDGNAQELED